MVDFLFNILLVGLLIEGAVLAIRACFFGKKGKEQKEQEERLRRRASHRLGERKERRHLPREPGALNGQKQRVCLSVLGAPVLIGSVGLACHQSSASSSASAAAVCRPQTSSSVNCGRLWCNSLPHTSSSTSSRRSLNPAKSQVSSGCSCDNITTSRSSLCCCSTSRSSVSLTNSNVSSKPSTVVRGSGFKMALLSNCAAVTAVGTAFADKPVAPFTESVVGQKLNVSSAFFGRSLRVHSDSSRDGSNSRSSSRRSSRPGSAFASVAPSPAQTPVEQPQSQAPTSSVVLNGKKIECYGVFCVTYDLKEDERPKTWKKMVRIAVSGAAGAISNHLLFKLASGEVFGPDQPIALNLLGSVKSRDALEGVAMELEDSLFPLLREVNIGIEALEVFQDADWALLIGAKPRGPGMERADLLDLNGQIFAEQAKALNAVASPDVKVMVVGNPCNTNALIAMKNAPRIPAKNFHALTRLDENRAKCQLALKAGVFYDNVSNVTIWGNHSTTQVPDFLNAKIHGRHVKDVITDHKWLEEEFTPRVQTRGGVLIKKWGRSSAASTAVSIADAIKSLITPTPEGDWFSSGVYTTGNPYGIAEDIVFSMPCRSKGDGDYEVVPDCLIDDYLYERIKKSEDELISEKKCVAHLIGEDGGFCDITEDTMLPGEQ